MENPTDELTISSEWQERVQQLLHFGKQDFFLKKIAAWITQWAGKLCMSLRDGESCSYEQIDTQMHLTVKNLTAISTPNT